MSVQRYKKKLKKPNEIKKREGMKPFPSLMHICLFVGDILANMLNICQTYGNICFNLILFKCM